MAAALFMFIEGKITNQQNYKSTKKTAFKGQLTSECRSIIC